MGICWYPENIDRRLAFNDASASKLTYTGSQGMCVLRARCKEEESAAQN